MSPNNILIIEDDPEITDLADINLDESNFTLDKAFDGQAGLEKARRDGYGLIVLDLMLAKGEGLEVSGLGRNEDIQTAVLMLAAKSEELDDVRGPELAT